MTADRNPAPSSYALRALKRKLGDVVHDSKRALEGASFDSIKLQVMPEAVIKPRKAEQVGELLKIANKYRVPVTTRGAGSSRTGGAVPVSGGWVCDLSKLTSLRIDKVYGLATCCAGVVLKKLQDKAEAAGWFYAPDPSSAKYCTVGGTIACNAGGLRGAKYGVTRDYVVALKGFFADGQPFEFGRPVRKWAVGYNLRDLMIGSEGTLGIVTSATLRLIPAPQARATCLLAFDDESKALTAAKDLMESGLMPAALEFFDSAAVAGMELYTGKPIEPEMPGAPLLLVEVDGQSAEVKVARKSLEQWAKKNARHVRLSRSEKEARALWDLRRSCSPAMFAHGDSKLNEDIVVPPAAYIKLIRFVHKLSKRSGLVIPVFGHAGDGNFHVNIMYQSRDAQQARVARQVLDELMDKVVQLGGAISGEHGIGLAKSPFLRMQLGKPELDAMLAIKQTLDPNNILNPDKIFQPTEIWDVPRLEVQLPWDAKKRAQNRL